MREIDPDYDAFWYEAYGRVALTGESIRAEHYAEPHGRWFDFHLSKLGPPDSRLVASVFQDITERKVAERKLRESEERQAFLLKLTDALRPLGDASEVQSTTTALVGVHLAVDRSMYGEVAGERGAEVGTIRGQYVRPASAEGPSPHPFSDRFTFEQFGARVMARRYSGEGFVVADVDTDPLFDPTERAAWAQAGVRAAIVVPLVKTGKLVAEFGVHSAKPREWTEAEVSLTREVAERTWAAAERARAEAALRESEKKYAALFAASPAPFLILTPDPPHFTILDVNDAYLAATMRNRENLVGRAMFEAFPDNPNDPVADGVRNLRASLERALVSGQFDLMDVQKYAIARPDGTFEERWWKPANAPVVDSNGKVVAIIHHVADVTAEHRAVVALRASEERFRAMAEQSEVGVAMADREGRLIWVNERFAEIAGHSREELMRLTVRDYSHPDDWPENDRLFRRLIEEGTSFVLEKRVDCASNSYRWSRVSVSPRDDQERIIGGIAVIVDITDRKRVEDTLRDSEERFRRFGEASQDILWMRDAETLQWTYLTAAFETTYGLSREKALEGDNYLSWLDLIVPEDRERAAQGIENVRTGEHVVLEYRVRRPSDGETRWLRNTDFPITDGTGRVAWVGGISHDITELRRAEEHQKTLLAELQHRVRNILAMIRSMVRQSSNGYTDLDEFSGHLIGRLNAMARTQVLLTRAAGAKVNLETLVRDELDVHIADERRMSIKGPEVELSAKAAEVLTLAVHELAANSIKYGALSDPAGRLDVTWGVAPLNGSDWLQLIWEEKSKQVQPSPPRTGFGTELIERRVPYELQGEASLHITGAGVRAEIAFPLNDGTSILETGPARGMSL